MKQNTSKKIFSSLYIMILVLSSYGTYLKADEFSAIAERDNVLDHDVQHAWGSGKIPIALDISGYVKAEAIFDSRQNLTERSGHFLFFPLRKRFDVLGEDINSRGDFDEYAIQTRVRIEAFGPDVFCMSSRSYIEGDFFGKTDETVETFRMRHAYLALESEDFTFIGGQTWHPISFPVEAPDTISFNSGTPIEAYSRNPQFRFAYHNSRIDLVGTLIGWLGDRPFGPIGPNSKYFRDAIMPDLNAQIRLKWNDAQSYINYIGAGFDVMRIVPRLVSNLDYKEVNPFTSIAANVYAQFAVCDILIYSKFVYAQNAAIWNMIGGYGVHTVDPATDVRTYAPLRTISFWSEFIYEGNVEPALFIGFAKNLGAGKRIIQEIGDEITVYGIGTNVGTVFRASPRVRWYINSFVVGAEVEYTRATYGIPDENGRVHNGIPVGNTRFLFATYYIF